MHPTEQFLDLLSKYTNAKLSSEEEAHFILFLQSGKYKDWLDMDVREKLQQNYNKNELAFLSEKRSGEILQSILNALTDRQSVGPVESPASSDSDRFLPSVPKVHRIHFLRTAWFRYAAAIVVFLSIATYLFFNTTKEKPSVTQNNTIPVQNDVPPGGNRATLTLADGTKIVLDSAKSGQLAREENATITKTADGRIVYEADQKLGTRILFNTMTTPNGGQYHLRLPDGTVVWLNAASSITYPTAFTGKTRSVAITGEAYFEVHTDKKMPFVVTLYNGNKVEVLGTHFNINSYTNENNIRTTLLEGHVRVAAGKKTIDIRPGQQVSSAQDQIELRSDVNTDQVTAWKNGRFNFDGQRLQEVMRQLARWYDIDVKYQGGIPELEFAGEMGRNLSLSQVLKGLGGVGVKYKIENKTLIVL
ncbi:MAG: FecR domain-containing protein [Chitinophagaceae bacterium]|nr:FecR domain-containing protein [Chitinophagaceae bacterium]